MPLTDTSEKGLETLIFTALTGFTGDGSGAPELVVLEPPGPPQGLAACPAIRKTMTAVMGLTWRG
ncbi:MAG TPA: hypothetical protein VFJ58_10590 [Armatimonadota bacterium]|nr:hypothetical protein [Armatimonadota bacterium]